MLPHEALWEKQIELEVRSALRLIPNDHLPHSKYVEFVKLVTGRNNPHLAEQIVRYTTRKAFDVSVRLMLEERQNYRCALCGVTLRSATSPQVDHIMPLAKGGDNAPSNLQILCGKCNSGKSALRAWVAGNPYFIEGDVLSPKLRYCVLTRHRGVCSVEECDESHLSSQMHVTPIIPIFRGGRFIFDNLKVLCQEHFSAEKAADDRAAKAALSRGLSDGGLGF